MRYKFDLAHKEIDMDDGRLTGRYTIESVKSCFAAIDAVDDEETSNPVHDGPVLRITNVVGKLKFNVE
jgi:hypothetical protein